MSYGTTGRLTNIEHDELWRNAFKAMPYIGDSLRRANGIAILKELHTIGKLDADAYARSLIALGKSEGFIFSED